MPEFVNGRWIDISVKRIGSSGVTYGLTRNDDLGLVAVMRGLVARKGTVLLERVLAKAVEYAKDLCPVGTRETGPEGHLRDSIFYVIEDEKTGSFGSPLRYAGYVNDGTRFMEGYHFLDGAVDKIKADLL